jgi:GntR family transcriptional regulator, transcriptional repressor for pyruvate dehydrogenase complex
MAALKLIDVGKGRSARVSAVDHEVMALVIDHGVQTDQVTVQQILDVRRTLEMRTVGLAALRRSDREAHEIKALAPRCAPISPTRTR